VERLSLSWHKLRAACLAFIASLVFAWLPAGGAQAADPGIWKLKRATTISFRYWQGITSVPGSAKPPLLFTGPVQGTYRTSNSLGEQVARDVGIPEQLTATEGYNHSGDPSWDPGEGGRLVTALECYVAGKGNTCGTGAFGVTDPSSLAWRYWVQLNPAEIKKAMWVESSPDGKLLWTSSGSDLLAYRASDVSPANSSPGAGPIRSVRKLAGAVPPSGVTGAVFWRGKLLLAGQDGTNFQVWSVDTSNGRRTLELERTVSGESEGLDIVPALGGLLQWQVMPATGTPPATYSQPTIMSFMPAKAPQLKLVARKSAGRLKVTVTTGPRQPIPNVRVSANTGPAWAGSRSSAVKQAWTGRDGVASLPESAAKRGTKLKASLAGMKSSSVKVH
jgi:hypothetical protein